MKYCPKCKTPVKAEQKFCTKCGERIIIEKEQQRTSPSISTQIYEKEKQKEDLHPAERKKGVAADKKNKSNKGFYVSVVIITLIFISAGAYYVLKENKIRNTSTLTQVPALTEKEKGFEFPLQNKMILMGSNLATINSIYPVMKKYTNVLYEISVEKDILAAFLFKDDKLNKVEVVNTAVLDTKENAIETLSNWINSRYGSGEVINRKSTEEVLIRWTIGDTSIEKETQRGWADHAGLQTKITIERKDKVVESASSPTTPTQPQPTPNPVHGAQVIIQPGPEGKDTYFGTSYVQNGGPDADQLSYGGWGDWYCDLIEFDLTNAPAADSVKSAKLYLYSTATPTNDPALKVHRITQKWTEASVSLYSHPTYEYHTTMSRIVKGWNVVDITTLYKDWKNNVYPYYGVMLSPTYNNATNASFYSSDYSDPTLRPKLVIDRLTP